MYYENSEFKRLIAGLDPSDIEYEDADLMIFHRRGSEKSLGPVRLNATVFILCSQGRMDMQVDESHVTLTEGQMLICPGSIQVVWGGCTEGTVIKAVLLTNRILQQILHSKIGVWNRILYIHRLNVITLEDKDRRLFHRYRDLMTELLTNSCGPYLKETMRALFASMFMVVYGSLEQMLPKDGETQPPTQVNYFHSFLELLNSHQARLRTVEAYADELCITPKYLSALCKKHSGKTANEWIHNHLLEEIRYYLRQTDLSVKDISNKLDFPNSSFFGKYVKQHFGMTPLQYRNRG